MQTTLKTDKLIPSDNYRKGMNKKAFKELTASVIAKGIIQPILVRPVKDGYQIVAGSRRHLAAQAAGLKEMPVVIREISDTEALELAVIENTQREDPNPMDEAEGFQKLLDCGEHTYETLAAKIGKEVPYVLGRLKLNDLPKKVQKLLRNGKINYGHAVLLTRVNDKEELDDLLRGILDDAYSLTVKGLAESIRGIRISNAVFELSDCKDCPTRSKNQVQLFPELKGTDECTDRKCFHAKTVEHYETIFSKLESDGHTVWKKPEQWEKYRYSYDSHIGSQKPKKYKSQCMKKCTDNHVYVFVQYSHGIETKELCLNLQCMRKMNGIKESASSSSGTPVSVNAQMHARDNRDRFLREKLPCLFQKSETLCLRLAIYHILNRWNTYLSEKGKEGVREVLLANEVYDKKKSLYQIVEAIPAKKLRKVLNQVSIMSVQLTDPMVLLRSAIEAGIVIEKEFQMDRDYLKKRTKVELVKFAAKLKIKGLKLEDKMKKGDMLDKIFEHDLIGKLTPELKASFEVHDGTIDRAYYGQEG